MARQDRHARCRHGWQALYLVLPQRRLCGPRPHVIHKVRQGRGRLRKESAAGQLFGDACYDSEVGRLQIACGVAFTTYLCPILQNYALFKTDLAVYATLTSFGPIYAIPLVMTVKGEVVSWRAMGGSLVAVAGVVPLWFAG